MTAPAALRIAGDFALPPDIVTQAVAILGRRGSGKTSTGVVLAEEMIRAGLPVVILDPLGVWHGLRSSVDGQSPGLPVVIFGGDHADLPLPPGSGALIADVIVDERPPAVIDLSGLDSDSEIRRWCTAFLRQVYKRNRDPLHIVIDEADLLAPQQGTGEAVQSLGATKAVARRGRVRGLGFTVITQRPASLAKEVLSQVEVLVAMQLTGPRDIAAVDDWMTQVGDEDTVREVRASLPSLATGESWWWSPAWLEVLRRVQVRPKETFDSSATPKAGETRVEPTRMAQVDLAALGDRIAALEEADQAAGEDPKKLRARIRDLERRLRERPAAEPERVEVPVLTDGQIAELEAAATRIAAVGSDILTAIRRAPAPPAAAPAPASRPEPAPNDADTAAARPTRRRPKRPARAATTNDDPGWTGAAAGLVAGARRMLDALARHHPASLTRAQVGMFAGMSPTGGSFTRYLSELRRLDLVDYAGSGLALTGEGQAATGATPDVLTRDAVLEEYRAALVRGARRMLDTLLAAPGPMTRDELAAAVDMTASGGSFTRYLSELRRVDLIDTGRTHIRLGAAVPPGDPA